MKKSINTGWMTAGFTAAGLLMAAIVPANAQHSTTPRSLRAQIEASAGEAPPAKEVKDDLFAGTEKFAKGASDVSEVTMDGDSLGMVAGKDSDLAKAMKLTVVRSYTYDKPGMYRMEDVEEFRKRLETGEWHCSVHIRESKTGESTDVCSKHRSDNLSETAIITVEPKELTFVHTIGTGWGGIIKDKKEKDKKDKSYIVVPGVDDKELDARLAVMGPEMEARMAEASARMAAMGPVMEARMAALRPLIEARMTAMRPEIEARMADMSARLAAMPAMPRVPELPAMPSAVMPPLAPAPPVAIPQP